MILVLKIVSPHLIYKKNVRLLILLLFVSFLADENDVITNNDDIINTPDIQIQKQKKSKYYNNISIYSL